MFFWIILCSSCQKNSKTFDIWISFRTFKIELYIKKICCLFLNVNQICVSFKLSSFSYLHRKILISFSLHINAKSITISQNLVYKLINCAFLSQKFAFLTIVSLFILVLEIGWNWSFKIYLTKQNSVMKLIVWTGA